MPTNLLLLPLLGGYWFLHAFHYSRFRSQRLDGYRLLVESALAGVCLSILARCLIIILRAWIPSLRNAWLAFAPDIPYLGTASVSLVIGIASPYVLNFLLERTGRMTRSDARRHAIERHGNALLHLLHRALAEERLISVTLDNRKVYIGALAAAPNLEPHETFIALVPWFSGYRDTVTSELVLTTPYVRVFEEQDLDPDDFMVVLPVSAIRSASYFDDKVYPAFAIRSEESGYIP